nr:MAG TPA: hypothetical protein [Inoviridae sp.]
MVNLYLIHENFPRNTATMSDKMNAAAPNQL